MTESLRTMLRRLLRGRHVSSALARISVDPRRFWLLVDLFGTLSERGEVIDQLGRNGIALKTAAWIYAFMSAVFTLPIATSHLSIRSYFFVSAGMGTFLLLTLLLSEAGNSLLNPAEAPVLAHRPINGATYAAAKLTHLVTIVLYLVPALNLVPAVAGLALEDSGWMYPLWHMLGALVAGILAALMSCALYGWLLYLMPARRLKTAGPFLATAPLIAFGMMGQVLPRIRRLGSWHWIVSEKWAISCGACIVCCITVGFGLRSLSVDRLIRISSGTKAKSTARPTPHPSTSAQVVARFFGGQPARAAYEFVWQMIKRDWQLRRQLAPLLLLVPLGFIPLMVKSWRIDPFSGRFTALHFLPHLFGIALFLLCNFLPYGADYKGGSIFLLAPASAFNEFATGIWASLWLRFVILPHVMIFAAFSYPWGILHAALFTIYSVAVASAYLALEIRRIDGAPFSKQADPSVGAASLPLMLLGGIVIALAVGIQYIALFHSAITVAEATVVLAAGAFMLTRASLNALAIAIRYHLALLAAGPGGRFYSEIAG